MIQVHLSTSQITATAVALLVAYIFVSAFVLPLLLGQGKFWDSQDWIGLKKQWLARYRAGFSTVRNTRSMVVEGYEKYSKHNKPYALPQFSAQPLVILPADKLQELLHLPDHRVDEYTPNSETIATDYTIGKGFSNGPHIAIVKRQLTRKLPLLTTDVYEELVLAMQNNWPATKDKWTAVKVYPTCMKIVSRAANRVFAGTELCRTPEFLESSRMYAISVFKTGGIMRLFPSALHPVVAPFLQGPIKKHRKTCKSLALPIIRKRIAHLRGETNDPEYKTPNDVLQWLLEDSIKNVATDPQGLDEDVITRRLLVLNMVAIHTTSIVTTNVLLDLYSSSHKDDFIAGIREECDRVLAQHNGVWSKDAVNSLLRVDSAIRESMRLSTLADIGMKRQIKDPNGVDLSDNIHLPVGVRVAVPSYAIHTDPRYYPDSPHQWDAFRFSRPREDYLSKVEAGQNPAHLQRVLEQKNQALIATGSEWLGFGHGRHSCPGRFFASQEMKLMLAHIVMNYDIKIEGGRPENISIMGSSRPTNGAEMLIRLR